jgi:hypothetical protein
MNASRRRMHFNCELQSQIAGCSPEMTLRERLHVRHMPQKKKFSPDPQVSVRKSGLELRILVPSVAHTMGLTAHTMGLAAHTMGLAAHTMGLAAHTI